MLDDQELGQKVQNLIIDVCLVLKSHGYHDVSVGSLMRVLGVPNNRAQAHDNELIDLNAELFGIDPEIANVVASNSTLH